MGQMFDKTRNQIDNRSWDHFSAFQDHIDHSNPQTTSLEKVKFTGQGSSWYDSNDLWAKLEPPRCLQYKPGNFLAIRPLNWDEMIDKDDDDENWVDHRAPTGGKTRPGDCNDNDDREGEEETEGGETGTRKGKGTKYGKEIGTGKKKG